VGDNYNSNNFNNFDNSDNNEELPPLTEVFGVQLKSERSDTQVYNIIRSIQFVLAQSYNLKNEIEIEESLCETGRYYYTISNTSSGLKTYIGRTTRDKTRLSFMFLDHSRIRWMKNEGFAMTDENCSKVGTIGMFQDLFSLVRFLAGKRDFKILEYCKK
jgi:hypothetical protein